MSILTDNKGQNKMMLVVEGWEMWDSACLEIGLDQDIVASVALKMPYVRICHLSGGSVSQELPLTATYCSCG